MTQAPYYLKNLNSVTGTHADFIGRIPHIPVDTNREATVNRLQPAHEAAVKSLGFCWSQLQRAEQVHGADIRVVGKNDPAQTWPAVDGLITADPRVLLGIYVADCGAVYIADPVKNVIALLHSGKKGTAGDITGRAIQLMVDRFGCQPSDMLVALAPCIRPPAYETDFAADIRHQAINAGVLGNQFTDSGICTSKDLDRYYSYRIEKGNTGRMLALLGMS